MEASGSACGIVAEVGAHQVDVFCVESRIGVIGSQKAANKQAGAGEKKHGNGDLAADE
jgi:hypothetical protein